MKHYQNAANLTTLKSSNRSLILRILNSMGALSRAELSRITGLTKTAITNIIDELIQSGILYETGTLNSQSGRKPILLNLSESAFYALGVYISRDHVCANLSNLKGSILYSHQMDLEFAEDERSFLETIHNTLQQVLDKAKIDTSQILGLGISSIGPLDISNGVILDPPNFRGRRVIPIVRDLEQHFGFKTFLENDMNACAIAEKLFGHGRNVANFVFVGVTNGIGAGIILNNNIFRGSAGFAGEIGHTTIDLQGNRCPCGNTGCLELYASIPAIVQQVQASLELGMESSLSGRDNIGWFDIVEQAAAGDPTCRKAIERLAYYLSMGLVNVVNTFDPEVVYLGYDIAQAGDLIIEPLNEMVNSHTLFRSSKQVQIQLSAFGVNAPHMGAPSIILDKFFDGLLQG